MSEIFDYHIRSEHDVSDAAPALCKVGNTPCIVWKGTGYGHPNIMPIVLNADGTVRFDTERKVYRSGDRVGGGIAIGQKDRNAAVIWPSGNGPSTLVGNTFNEDLEVVEDIVALGQTTDYAPALCWWIHELNMAWTGEDQHLNVAPLSTGDSGWEFLRERVFTSGETSEYEPALAWGPAPNRLYLAWTGEGAGELNIMYCQGGAWSDPPPNRSVFDSATKRTFPNETSEAGPSIYVTGAAVTLAYRGSGNRNINLLELEIDEHGNYTATRKRTSGHTTRFRPAYGNFFDRRWIAYTGDDDHLYLARVGQ